MKKIQFILDVESSKISLFACSMIKSNSIILASSEQLYDGFMDGEFLEPSEITDAVQKLMEDMTKKLNVKIKEVYVGVPSEFSICVCKRKVRKYLSLVKLNESLVDELYDGIEDFKDADDYKLISFSPMQFVLDGGFKTIQPIGKKTSQVTLDCSYILVKKNFINKFDYLLHNLGVSTINYVSTILGQALLATKDVINEVQPIAIVDVGHLTTSVAIIKGEGLALLSSFSLGGGHITADIMQLLQKSFREAELLKRKVILTIQPQKDEKYVVNKDGEIISAHIQITNDIVKSRIENISQVINNILDIDEAFKDIPIFLTGGGICHIKGAENIMERITNRKVNIFQVPFDNTENRYSTSILGLNELISRLI